MTGAFERLLRNEDANGDGCSSFCTCKSAIAFHEELAITAEEREGVQVALAYSTPLSFALEPILLAPVERQKPVCLRLCQLSCYCRRVTASFTLVFLRTSAITVWRV